MTPPSYFGVLVCWLLLTAAPAAWAQRPVAERARPAGTPAFWLLAPGSGQVEFTGATTRSRAQLLARFERLFPGPLLTASASYPGADSVLHLRGWARGVQAGVQLGCTLHAWPLAGHAGYQYRLSGFDIAAPTGAGLRQHHALSRVLADADFRAEVDAFQLLVQRALVALTTP